MVRILLSLILCLALPAQAMSPAFMGSGKKVNTTACVPSTLGTTTYDSASSANAAKKIYCYYVTASVAAGCTGDLGSGHIRKDDTNQAAAKVLVYSAGAGSNPGIGNTLIGTSGAISTASSGDVSAAMDGGTLVDGTNYLICVAIDDDTANAFQIDKSSTTGTTYANDTGYCEDVYDNPPANFNDCTWTAVPGANNRSIWVDVN